MHKKNIAYIITAHVPVEYPTLQDAIWAFNAGGERASQALAEWVPLQFRFKDGSIYSFSGHEVDVLRRGEGYWLANKHVLANKRVFSSLKDLGRVLVMEAPRFNYAVITYKNGVNEILSLPGLCYAMAINELGPMGFLDL